MRYLLIAAFVFAVLVWLGRSGKGGERRDWRVASTILSMAALAGSVISGAKGMWLLSAGLLVASALLGADFRRRGGPAPVRAPDLGEAEARSILGVEAGASRQEIQAAYTRLMRSVHPDAGGTSGLAAQLNAARDRLLGKG